MATTGGHEGAVVEQGIGLESDGQAFRMLREMLEDEPFRVRFFQAVRLLERMEKTRGEVGYFAQPRDETIRFATQPSLSFPPSELYDLERMPNGQLKMTVQFMGLCAALSALPSVYTEAVMVRLREKDGAMAEFFDLFNHRLISFFYRAWEKNHFFVGLEAGKDDALSLRLLDVLGLGTEDMRNRAGISDRTCVYYAGLLGRQVRTADSLRQILEDYFGVPVEVNQFAGTWRTLPKQNRTFLTGSNQASERLGFGVVAGEEVWDHHGRIRISLGPLDFEQYGYFLPGESGYRDLAGWVQFYSDGAYETEVQLILKREEVPACEMGGQGAARPRLGLVSWLKTKPKAVDAREATYLLT